MRLILVRHPQPLVAPGICYGRSDLAPEPAALATLAAQLLPLLPAATPIFSSPLRRCAELATQLAATLPHASLTLDARLMEMDFGAWEMRAWEAIARAEIDAWAADPAGYHPGGGESVSQMAARVAAFDAGLVRQAPDCAIVICHAGTMRLLAEIQPGRTIDAIARAAASSARSFPYGAAITLERN